MAYHRSLGLSVKVTDDLGGLAAPGAFGALNTRRESEELAEQARVLYVAMTRARDYLVLCGPPDARKGDSWFTSMHRVFNVLDRADGDQLSGNGWSAQVWRSARHVPTRAGEMPDEPLPADGVLAARVGPAVREAWTPDVFAITRVLEAFKMGGAEEEPDREDEVRIGRGAAQRRGTLVHRFLELWDCVAQPDQLIDDLLLAECPFREHRDAIAADLHRVASMLKSHEWGGRLARTAGLRKEVPFLLRLDRVLVRGTIDALLDDGSIVDYKTGRRTPEKDEVYRRQIQLYADALRSLTGKLPPAGYLLYLDGERGLEIDVVDVSAHAVERTQAEAVALLRNVADAPASLNS